MKIATQKLVLAAFVVSFVASFLLGWHLGRKKERSRPGVTTILAIPEDADIDDVVMLVAKFCATHPNAKFYTFSTEDTCTADGTPPR